MFFKLAVALLGVWLVGMFGIYDIGDAFHLLLLLGGMFLLLAILRSREAALERYRLEQRDRT